MMVSSHVEPKMVPTTRGGKIGEVQRKVEMRNSLMLWNSKKRPGCSAQSWVRVLLTV